ncbi:hypothetical protein FRC03_001774 [Tulasnella sp. 419]|nr:hypothetical protein FRC03_001774 [Tulasnella sp. 419]
MSTHRVTLQPQPGFCVKTTSLESGTYTVISRPDPIDASSNSKLDKSATQVVTTVPKGHKIFVNVAWDNNVPPPPQKSEEDIRKAMMGADLDTSSAGAYFVPVIVSDGRVVNDKAGKPSLVFDCVFSAALKSRCTKDYDFRTFLTEIALERVEDKSGLTLSREIALPNIASKGILEPRSVLIPSTRPLAPTKPLIEELPSAQKPTAHKQNDVNKIISPMWSAVPEAFQGGLGVKLTILVPKLTKALFGSGTILDVEANRIIFRVPGVYVLDLRLDDSGEFSAIEGEYEDDTPISRSGGKGMDPDSAVAEWSVGDGVVVIRVKWV